MTENTSTHVVHTHSQVRPRDVVIGTASCTLTASEIISLRGPVHEWRGWMEGCDQKVHFTLDQIDSVPFCIVRHLVKHHGLTPDAVVKAEHHFHPRPGASPDQATCTSDKSRTEPGTCTPSPFEVAA